MAFKRDEVLANYANLRVDDNGIYNSQSYKHKAAVVGKKEDGNNANSFVKTQK